MTLKNFERGTVSHGTLLPEDLVCAFGNEILRLLAGTSEFPDIDLEYVGKLIDDPSKADEFDLDMLFETLDALAPGGYYFGAHEDDGYDFGFWKCEY